jgi:hypothetical protein
MSPPRGRRLPVTDDNNHYESVGSDGSASSPSTPSLSRPERDGPEPRPRHQDRSAPRSVVASPSGRGSRVEAVTRLVAADGRTPGRVPLDRLDDRSVGGVDSGRTAPTSGDRVHGTRQSRGATGSAPPGDQPHVDPITDAVGRPGGRLREGGAPGSSGEQRAARGVRRRRSWSPFTTQSTVVASHSSVTTVHPVKTGPLRRADSRDGGSRRWIRLGVRCQLNYAARMNYR